MNFCDVIFKVLNCGNKISQFDLKSYYYVHFQTNTLWKDMDLHIHPTTMG